MPKLIYQGTEYERRDGETVLEALVRQGIDTPFSCRNGSCHACLVRAVDGAVPEAASRSLRPELRAAGYFLACTAVPEGDLALEPRREEDLFSRALVRGKEWLAPSVCRLSLDAGPSFSYRPGQFVNLRRPDGVTRSYSLASLPGHYFLELHVGRMRNGEMSNWIADVLEPGDEIDLQGPLGAATYAVASLDQPLLLIGTGTGLAPLLGIVRAALAAGHRGPIELYHGSREPRGIYLFDEVTALERHHANFRFTACLSGDHVPRGFARGRADDVAFLRHTELASWRVHLAGLPAMVRFGEMRARLAGADCADIVADPFDYRDLRERPRATTEAASSTGASGSRPDPPPDMELWAALAGGRLLDEILVDLYGRVYEDPRLAPFFRGVTKQRAIEKQFAFLREILTGEKLFFGERPANAHHWMVISDELFDYREELFMACVARAGIAPRWIARWRALHEHYRLEIVKAAPRPKHMGAIEMPLDGFGEETMTVGTLCDACGRAIEVGERVRYHLRLGDTFCSDCSGRSLASAGSAGGGSP